MDSFPQKNPKDDLKIVTPKESYPLHYERNSIYGNSQWKGFGLRETFTSLTWKDNWDGIGDILLNIRFLLRTYLKISK